ncbi:hypothetical protein [Stappia sp. ES.058]|uniref:hypothetical protein n=1 Tax=Stappia sp. ES.058 TaxID=1881061 RepID=UPI00087CC2AC|nr:hypothetical protein [Stappia sp. ES.058]SDU35171.1 hypothetical protein SAMN05428979_3164 [Stappia sp. ES.058]
MEILGFRIPGIFVFLGAFALLGFGFYRLHRKSDPTHAERRKMWHPATDQARAGTVRNHSGGGADP